MKSSIIAPKSELSLLTQSLEQGLISYLERLADDLHKKYDVPREEVLRGVSMVPENKEPSLKTQQTTQQTTQTEESIEKKLLTKKKNELVEICKSKNLYITGTKKNLVDRILGREKPKNTKKKKNVKSNPTIIDHLVSKLEKIEITKNEHGNYHHSNTNLVFDKETQKVVGKQLNNGEIQPIDAEMIDLCNKYKFSFVLPENLKNQNTIDEPEEKASEEEELEEEELEEEELEEEELEEEELEEEELEEEELEEEVEYEDEEEIEEEEVEYEEVYE